MYVVDEDFRHQLNWVLNTWEILLKSKKKYIHPPSLKGTFFNYLQQTEKKQKQSSSAELWLIIQ